MKMAVMSVVLAVGLPVSLVTAHEGCRGEREQAVCASGPVWVPALLNPLFDAGYQDERTHTSIQQDIARRLADPSLEITVGDPEDLGPMSACFDEGAVVSPEIMQIVNSYIAGVFGTRYQLGTRWTGTVGNTINLTWSFVPDGLSIPNGIGEPTANSTLFSSMDTKFGGVANRATWITQFQNCFNRWADLTGTSYTRVTAAGVDWDDGAAWGSGSGATRGAVRISMKPIDGGSGILAYNAFPQNGDMVMDSAENWQSSTNSYRFMRNTVMHEHGHGLGLNHVCPIQQTKLMEPFLSTNFDGPQQDDIRAISYFYGDAYEPNGTFGTAYNVGTLTPGSTTNIGQILSGAANAATCAFNDNDQDWFQVSLADPKLVNITVTPVGTTYLSGPQNPDGSCSAGTNINALSVANPVLTIYSGNGTTVLHTLDAGAAGATETLSNFLFSQAGTYVRITENGTPASQQSQLYRWSITVQNTNIAPSATDGTFTDKVRVTWGAIGNATNYEVLRNTTNSVIGITSLGTTTSTTFDDTTAAPGVTYYYYLRVEQFGSGLFRYTVNSGSGEAGSRGIPPNSPPVANAGSDITVTDSDNSGSEAVTLNGSGSSDPDGSITLYEWLDGATLLSSSASPTFNTTFPVGSYTITLRVTDNGTPGLTATDTVLVTVNAGAGCDSIDFNNDGVSPDSQDIEDFVSVFGGGGCSNDPNCNDIDFNNDSVSPDIADLTLFLEVYGGGSC
jgi:hypothetical protein